MNLHVVSVGSTASSVLILYNPENEVLPGEPCQQSNSPRQKRGQAASHLQSSKQENRANGYFESYLHLKSDHLRDRYAE